MRVWNRRLVIRLLLVCLCAATAIGTRSRLLRTRATLGLTSRGRDSVVAETSRTPTYASRLVLASAALGVFRAVAIDYLWIRAVRLQEQGVFFEATTLARLITGLQPRLPVVWTFQARNLAYNISASMPPGERYPWILEGIRLLRERALLFNPGSPVILLELAFFFQHKIGLDFDDAGYLYRTELARTFEVDRRTPAGKELLARWGLDPEHLARVGTRWGLELDLRAAESHALYWAELGRGSERLADDAFTRRTLDIVVRSSILQLFTGGRPVRSPLGPVRAFVPDLRLDGPVRHVLELELERARQVPAVRALVEEVHRAHLARLVFFLFLHGKEEASRKAFLDSRKELAPLTASLEDYLVENVGFLTELEEENGEPHAGHSHVEAHPPHERELRSLASCLDAAFLLEVAGELELARGFRRLAELVHARGSAPGGDAHSPRPAFDDFAREAVRWRLARWKVRPELWEKVPETLRSRLPGEGVEHADQALPHQDALPFRLELLDPLSLPERISDTGILERE